MFTEEFTFYTLLLGLKNKYNNYYYNLKLFILKTSPFQDSLESN